MSTYQGSGGAGLPPRERTLLDDVDDVMIDVRQIEDRLAAALRARKGSVGLFQELVDRLRTHGAALLQSAEFAGVKTSYRFVWRYKTAPEATRFDPPSLAKRAPPGKDHLTNVLGYCVHTLALARELYETFYKGKVHDADLSQWIADLACYVIATGNEIDYVKRRLILKQEAT